MGKFTICTKGLLIIITFLRKRTKNYLQKFKYFIWYDFSQVIDENPIIDDEESKNKILIFRSLMIKNVPHRFQKQPFLPPLHFFPINYIYLFIFLFSLFI